MATFSTNWKILQIMRTFYFCKNGIIFINVNVEIVISWNSQNQIAREIILQYQQTILISTISKNNNFEITYLNRFKLPQIDWSKACTNFSKLFRDQVAWSLAGATNQRDMSYFCFKAYAPQGNKQCSNLCTILIKSWTIVASPTSIVSHYHNEVKYFV